MKCDHRETETRNDFQRQMNQRGEYDHRDANNPDHLKKKEQFRVYAESHEESNHGNLKNDQPQSACDQKARQLALAFATGKLQIRSSAREKDKYRCAEVGYPAREKK